MFADPKKKKKKTWENAAQGVDVLAFVDETGSIM
jgi:hypothetical protein